MKLSKSGGSRAAGRFKWEDLFLFIVVITICVTVDNTTAGDMDSLRIPPLIVSMTRDSLKENLLSERRISCTYRHRFLMGSPRWPGQNVMEPGKELEREIMRALPTDVPGNSTNITITKHDSIGTGEWIKVMRSTSLLSSVGVDDSSRFAVVRMHEFVEKSLTRYSEILTVPTFRVDEDYSISVPRDEWLWSQATVAPEVEDQAQLFSASKISFLELERWLLDNSQALSDTMAVPENIARLFLVDYYAKTVLRSAHLWHRPSNVGHTTRLGFSVDAVSNRGICDEQLRIEGVITLDIHNEFMSELTFSGICKCQDQDAKFPITGYGVITVQIHSGPIRE